MKHRVVTNKSFESYINYLNNRRRYKFEDRWDSLDLDDITTSIDVPSQGKVDSAVRDLDIVDDVAAKTGAQDIEVGSDGKLRLLDFDDEKQDAETSNKGDARVAGLDLDDKPKKRIRKSQSNKEDDKIREIDFDEKGVEVSHKKSNIGTAIGALDYDDDVDVSHLVATIDDVYTALSSEDQNVVKSTIKKYAGDITDDNKIKEIMLGHAVKLNYNSLRVMCGDMRVVITAKEKSLGFIDRAEIKNVLQRLKEIASSLTGENNTYGLIPNAIVSCSQDDQTTCINIIDFLTTWCDLPIMSIYFRGAMTRRLYKLADYIIDELPDVKFDEGYLIGTRGLLTRIKNYDDVPNKIIEKIAAHCDTKKLSSRIIGDFVIMCLSNNNNKAAKAVFKDMSDSKKEIVIDYIDDNDASAYQKLAKLLKL